MKARRPPPAHRRRRRLRLLAALVALPAVALLNAAALGVSQSQRHVVGATAAARAGGAVAAADPRLSSPAPAEPVAGAPAMLPGGSLAVPAPLPPVTPQPPPVAPLAPRAVPASTVVPARPVDGTRSPASSPRGAMPAPAPPAEGGAPASMEQRKGEQALALIDYPWRTTTFDIVFLPAEPGYRALLIARSRRIEVYVRPADTVRELAYVIAHEIGHAVDLAFNGAARRAAYLEARGLAGDTEWFPCRRCEDLESGAGDFAEVFALWLLGPGQFSSRLAPAPGGGELEQLAAFFWP